MSLTPYYADDNVTLYLGDFRDIVPQLDIRADLLIADPPYGETKLQWDRWPDGWPAEAARYADLMWCFGSMRMFLERAGEFTHWKFSQDLVWEKQNGSGLHKDRFKRVHEFATLWYQGAWADLQHQTPTTNDARARTVRTKAKPTHHQGDRGPQHFVSEDGGPRLQRSVIRMRNMHGRAINETEKPPGLVEIMLEYACPPGGLVLDVFAGSAVTGLVATQTGRRAVLCELRESQCEAAALRLSQGSLALHGAGA